MSKYVQLYTQGQFVPFTTSILFANASSKRPYFHPRESDGLLVPFDKPRPVASISLYNHTQQPVTVTLQPQVATYLPGLFLQDRYNDASAFVNDSASGPRFAITQPMDATKPALKSLWTKNQS